MFYKIVRAFEFLFIFFIFAALFRYSNPSLTDQIEKVRAFTRQREFNYVTWTFDAAFLKLQSASIGDSYILGRVEQKQIVVEYMRITQLAIDTEFELEKIYSDPAILDKEKASAELRADLNKIYQRQKELAPLAEAVLQEQVSQILSELGLTSLGQPVPPLLYHSTPLPFALIVSRRDKVEQIANISMDTDFTVDEQVTLEENVDKKLNTSSLVVPIGGVGVYPTMVYRTTDLNWLLSTISHEWTHNYLTIRPLGFLYTESPELRTMNETTASIAGDEIGRLVLERYYPELTTASDLNLSLIALPNSSSHPEDEPFDFRAEMHETRIQADALLAEGKIDEAESYMESRRQVFLANGYLIRKLNQAYFAFYGAYADTPGGAAGEDPVGPAVRTLRVQSDSLADFINTIAWMTSFEQLQEAIK